MSLLLALTGVALAADLSIGASVNSNDPFLLQKSVVASGAVGFAPGARVGLMAAYSPNLGRADWQPITSQLVDENHVSPDISRRGFDGALTLQVEPFRGRVATVGTAMALYAGLGLVWTHDDLDALQTDSDDERAVTTEFQLHPDLVWGLQGDVYPWEAVGFRLRWHHISWIETVNATTLEMRDLQTLGLEVVVLIGPAERAAMQGGGDR